MRQVVFILFAFYFFKATNVLADKIYLKSGEILEGKVKERSPLDMKSGWCEDEKSSVVWDEGSSRCIETATIERIEKEFKAPEGVQLLAKPNQWGDEKYGYQTQLITMDEKYFVGQPMKFSLVMRNVTESRKWYDQQGIANDPFVIKDSGGQKVYNKAPDFQTGGSGQPIDTGEIVTLIENIDITTEYLISQPDIYFIQFREGSYGFAADGWFPASNVVQFTALPGEPMKEDLLIQELMNEVPERWHVAGGGNRREVSPLGRTSDTGVEVFLVTHPSSSKGLYVSLWQTEYSVEVQASGQPTEKQVSEYLGHGNLGHFYILIPTEAEELWPTIREDVKQALAIR